MAVKRRKFIRTISYLVAVCMVFAVSGMFTQRAKADYEETLGKVRMANLGSLSECFRDISAGLRLLAVSADVSVAESISYVEARVMGANGCLNGFNSKKVKNIGKYLTSLSRFMQDFSGTSEKRKTAIHLSEYAQEVYFHLNDVSSAVLNGAYSLTEHGSIYRDDEKPYFENFVDYSNGKEKELFSSAAPAIATEHSSFFDKKEDITEETARETASKLTGLNPALWRENKTSKNVFSFRHGDVAVDISKTGMLCGYINPVFCKKAKLTSDEAEKKATGFLNDNGYADMIALRREISEFTASFLFYPLVNGVVLMDSWVMVEVCRSEGETVYFDSFEYIMNYTDDISAPGMLPEMNGVLPENLTLIRSFYCVREINGRETLCVLSECRSDGYNYHIYTEPITMKILKTENV